MYILTFDIEDWFHTFDRAYYGKPALWETLPTSLEKNVYRISDFLDEMDIKATFFWLGWEAEKHPIVVKRLADKGHEIAAHSFFHRKINDIGRKAFKDDTGRVVKMLEDIIGKKIISYRAPGMSVKNSTLWALEVLQELGIKYDSSVVSVKGNKMPETSFVFKHGEIEIKEFPVPALSIGSTKFNYSSSGYFRIAPYWWIKDKMGNKDYMLSYFHPRDFDPEIHKYISRNPLLKMRYRMGAGSCMKKLKQLTKEFDFINLSEAADKINWESAPVVEF
jgi:polysaccharide deacetylase family protein (PEP-CTERM system associated)